MITILKRSDNTIFPRENILIKEKEFPNENIFSPFVEKSILFPTENKVQTKPYNHVSKEIEYSTKPTYSNNYNNIFYANNSITPNCIFSDIYAEEFFVRICDQNSLKNFKPYNPILKAMGSGIIPYTIINDQIYFLLQKLISPIKRKDSGWVDFGGKKDANESTITTATREFSEETSCLFYLKEQSDEKSVELYKKLKDNPTLTYDTETIKELINLIPIAEKYYFDKINAYVDPVYVSSKETYISYLIKVNYIPIMDIPRAEDIHIPYEERYIRKCKWFSLGELYLLEERFLHKRLQITKVKNRIQNYYNKGLLD